MVTQSLCTLINCVMGHTDLDACRDRITLGCGLLFALVAIVRGSAPLLSFCPGGHSIPFQPLSSSHSGSSTTGSRVSAHFLSIPLVISAKLHGHIPTMLGPSAALLLILQLFSVFSGLSDALPTPARQSRTLVVRQNGDNLSQPVTVQTQDILQTYVVILPVNVLKYLSIADRLVQCKRRVPLP